MKLATVVLQAALCLFVFTDAAPAQLGSGLITPQDATRNGLERAWFTQVQVDRGRGAVAHVRVHVSSKHIQRKFEVHSKLGVEVFSDRHLDSYGNPLGVDKAKEAAEEALAEVKPIDPEAKVVERAAPDITLYAVTNRGIVQAIDAETGASRWLTSVGSRDHVTMAPAASDDFLVVVNGTHFYVLDSQTGEVSWSKETRSVAGAGGAVTADLVWIPTLSGVVESYSLVNPLYWPQIHKSHGRAMSQPTVLGNVVAWPTDRGHANVARQGQRGVRYRLYMNEPIVGRIGALHPDKLVIGTSSGYVYCVQQSYGDLVWRYSTGEVMRYAPTVIGNSVYVMAQNSGLFAISGSDGTDQWWAAGIRSLIGGSERRLYCTDRTGSLLILDRQTGARIARLDTPSLDLSILNTQTDRIYLATSTGLIQCLREVGAEHPLLHIETFEQQAAKPETVQQGLEEQKPEDKAAPNPFGGNPFNAKPPAGGNPFK